MLVFMKGMQPELLRAASQLLKSRLRHYVYSAKARECGAEERVWRSLLLLEDEIEARAYAAWVEARASQPMGGSLLVPLLRSALTLAIAGAAETFGPERTVELQPLVDQFIREFEPSELFVVEGA